MRIGFGLPWDPLNWLIRLDWIRWNDGWIICMENLVISNTKLTIIKRHVVPISMAGLPARGFYEYDETGRKIC